MHRKHIQQGYQTEHLNRYSGACTNDDKVREVDGERGDGRTEDSEDVGGGFDDLVEGIGD